jgi:hypothetical protein
VTLLNDWEIESETPDQAQQAQDPTQPVAPVAAAPPPEAIAPPTDWQVEHEAPDTPDPVLPPPPAASPAAATAQASKSQTQQVLSNLLTLAPTVTAVKRTPQQQQLYDATLKKAQAADVQRRNTEQGEFGGVLPALGGTMPLPLGPEIRGGLAAAGNTAQNLYRDVTGQPTVPSGPIYDATREAEREYQAQTGKLHPVASTIGGILSGLGGGVEASGVSAAKALLPEALKSGLFSGATGAVTGATEGNTWEDRLQNAAKTGLLNAVAGFGLHAGLGGATNLVARGADPDLPGNVLRASGIATTAAQRAGPFFKSMEDLGKRLPIVGQAMTGLQSRQIEQYNRAVGLHALSFINENLPADIKAGFPLVQHVEDKIGDAYKWAMSLAPSYSLDKEFVDDATRIGSARPNLSNLDKDHWDSIVHDKLERLSDPAVSTDVVKRVYSELGDTQRELAKKGSDALAGMVGDLKRSVLGPIERAYPEARAAIGQADQAYRTYIPMNNAAKAAAVSRDGVFLPSQFGRAAVQQANGGGSLMAGKGRAVLQNLTSAASKVIPDSYGNPGTANAMTMASVIAGLMSPLTRGQWGPAIAAGKLGLVGAAAATPYLLKGRQIIEHLGDAAGPSALQNAALRLRQYAAKDPNVAPLYRAVTARLYPQQQATQPGRTAR